MWKTNKKVKYGNSSKDDFSLCDVYRKIYIIASNKKPFVMGERERKRKDEDGVSGDGKVTFMTAAIQLTNVFCVL